MSASLPPVDDATLGAFLDGELPPAEAESLAARIADDKVLAERLAALRDQDAALREAFAPIAEEPLPAGLRAAAETLAKARRDAAVIAFPPARAPAPQPARTLALTAAAAALALAIGLGLGLRLGGTEPVGTVQLQDLRRVAEGGLLHTALETAPSGQNVAASGTRIDLVLTFVGRDGRVCREFEAHAGRETSVGLACRDASGWHVAVLLQAQPSASDPGGYAPASGYSAAALEAVLEEMMEGSPLDAGAERALIERSWVR